MHKKKIRILALFGTVMLAGCAVRRYQAVPLVPTESASKLDSRSLADPGLHAYLEKNLAGRITTWPPRSWGLETLSFAAVYFNPAIEIARSRVAETEAAIVTAGARPNPTLSAAPERTWTRSPPRVFSTKTTESTPCNSG